MEPFRSLQFRIVGDGKLLRPLVWCAFFLSSTFTAAGAAEPNIDTKNFTVDCRPLIGNTERGLKKTLRGSSGFTAVISDAAHRHYNARRRAGLQYWVLPGDVAQLKPPAKSIAAFSSRQQVVQLYGAMRPGSVYTLFVTAKNERGEMIAARTVIKASKCMPYVEPGIIPNELRHDRPKPLAQLDRGLSRHWNRSSARRAKIALPGAG